MTPVVIAEDKIPNLPQKSAYVMNVHKDANTTLEAHFEPSKADIEQYIKTVFSSEYRNAIKIAECESGLNINAYNDNDGMNGYHAYGLFQVHNYFWTEEKYNWKTNWKDNVDMAKHIYNISGWHAWSCAKITGVI